MDDETQSLPFPLAGGDHPFLRTALSLGFLSEEAAIALLQSRDAVERTIPDEAMRCGLLTISQVDIVRALIRPSEFVPGYEIVKYIGHGGMGVVFSAIQQNLQRIVALKTVLLSQLAGAAAARLQQEAVTVAKLQHPHIVAAYDFGCHEGRFYFAMEMVPGEDLDCRISREGPFVEAATWGVVRQAASGLAHAARSGVVHRDIKPANLLLVEPPAGFHLPKGVPLVKIADFGLAFLTEEAELRTRLTAINAAVGSPHYMAPEQLERSAIDHRADIYALGATAYHMLSGVAPFSGGTLSQILTEKVTRGPRPIREVAPDVSDVSAALVERLMHREPAGRPADYDALIAEIDLVLAQPDVARAAFIGTSASMPETTVDFATGGPVRVGSQSPTLPPADDPTQVLRPPDRTSQLSAAVRAAETRRRLTRASIALVAAAIGIAAPSYFLIDRAPPAPPAVESTGQQEWLFDGMSLGSPWHIHSGRWRIRNDEWGARVISGTDGRIGRGIRPAEPDREVALPYRVTFLVFPNDASTVDVEFAVASSADVPAREVLRISGKEAKVGAAKAGSNDLRRASSAHPLTEAANASHVVRIERHESGWWAWVDDQLIGFAKATRRDRPEFRLRVDGGTAHFSDVALESLRSIPRVE